MIEQAKIQLKMVEKELVRVQELRATSKIELREYKAQWETAKIEKNGTSLLEIRGKMDGIWKVRERLASDMCALQAEKSNIYMQFPKLNPANKPKRKKQKSKS